VPLETPPVPAPVDPPVVEVDPPAEAPPAEPDPLSAGSTPVAHPTDEQNAIVTNDGVKNRFELRRTVLTGEYSVRVETSATVDESRQSLAPSGAISEIARVRAAHGPARSVERVVERPLHEVRCRP
jgi:hypothetical protein